MHSTTWERTPPRRGANPVHARASTVRSRGQAVGQQQPSLRPHLSPAGRTLHSDPHPDPCLSPSISPPQTTFAGTPAAPPSTHTQCLDPNASQRKLTSLLLGRRDAVGRWIVRCRAPAVSPVRTFSSASHTNVNVRHRRRRRRGAVPRSIPSVASSTFPGGRCGLRPRARHPA